MKINEDGSVWVFAGPKPPKGWESNWVQTVPGRGWFPYIRLYGPGEKWFDEDAFKLLQVEKVDFKKLAKLFLQWLFMVAADSIKPAAATLSIIRTVICAIKTLYAFHCQPLL